MYCFEKDYSKIKKYDKKHFNILTCIIVILVALIIYASIFVKSGVATFIAPLLWFPLIICIMALIIMKLSNRTINQYSEKREYIEFYPDHLVVCEKVSAFEPYYNYCKIYYDEIEGSYLYKKRRTGKFLYMNISVSTNSTKSSIQNHYYGNNYTFSINLGLYPEELIDYLLNNCKDIMKITIRKYRNNRHF